MSTPSASLGRSFAFVAARPGGGRSFGVRTARDRRALADLLGRERLILLQAWGLPEWATPSREFKLKDQAELNGQLAQLLSRGVPLVEALEVVSATVRKPARPRVDKMREMVSAGSSFSEACRGVGGFDVVTVAVYRAAERTGDLAGAAGQLATNARRRLAMGNKAQTLLIYPAVVVSISLAVSLLMLGVVVPRIGEALVSLNPDLELPWYSRLTIGAGEILRARWAWLLGAAAVLGVLAVLARRELATLGAGLTRRIPVFRDLVLAQESARFFSVMAAMTRSGVPLADALGTANATVRHAQLRAQLDTLRQRLIEGGVLRSLIDGVSALPLATRRLLTAAERSGDIESAFDTIAKDLADHVDEQAQRALALLEPLLIVGMFLLIGSLLLSIMVPLISVTSQAI